MKELTKAQEDILKVLWEIQDGAVSDVLDKLKDPKPAYNTVATVIKVLEKKGYVIHRTYGKTNVYSAKISKQDYAQNMLKSSIKGLFNGSLNQMMSFFVKSNDVSINELEELKIMLETEIKKQKK
jgi:BlaI family transcriptional regulator, penicillinase repressor